MRSVNFLIKNCAGKKGGNEYNSRNCIMHPSKSPPECRRTRSESLKQPFEIAPQLISRFIPKISLLVQTPYDDLFERRSQLFVKTVQVIACRRLDGCQRRIVSFTLRRIGPTQHLAQHNAETKD